MSFAKGQQYTDYNAGIDEVAAYTIGGLVAGKVLAKVGFFAIILKFWKLGFLALGGAWAAIKRLLRLWLQGGLAQPHGRPAGRTGRAADRPARH